MKFTTSGVPARVKRRYDLFLSGMSMLTAAVVMVFASLYANTSSYALVADCIPSNNRLSDALGPLFDLITGAVGGLIPAVVLLIIVIGVFAGFFALLRKRDASTIFQILVGAPAVVLIAILILIIFYAFYGAINSSC